MAFFALFVDNVARARLDFVERFVADGIRYATFETNAAGVVPVRSLRPLHSRWSIHFSEESRV